MSSFRRINAIFKRQIKDTLKNKTVLIQFVMFPLLTVIMANAINMGNMPENFFVNLFATMFIGMAPLMSMTAIMSEEKEKNTLRILLMSNVNAVEYLIGVGLYIIILCLAGSCVIASQGDFATVEFVKFIGIMLIGIVISTLVGAVIGICSKNQMSATSLSMSLMMIFSFLPMIASFNQSIGKVSKFIYSQQISNMLESVAKKSVNSQSLIILSVNFAIVVLVFLISFRKKGLVA